VKLKMIVEKKFLNKLKQFGLNSYEAKIWTALLSRGISTAGELSDISNVPRSRSYDVLEGLEKKGFIIMKIGKPIKYIAVNPSEVLERVKKITKEEAEKQVVALDEIKETDLFEQLNMLHNNGMDLVDPTELSASFKNRMNVYGHIESMIKSAEQSIVIMTTEDGLLRKAKNFKRALKKANERGVKIRILAPITSKSEEAASELSEVAEVRHVDSIKARLCIVDGKEIAFMLMDDSVEASYDAGVWINTKFFCEALAVMFNEAWKTAKPLLVKN
jgi:sugar-specific transcriptional regulator TrmB